jgi:hypothetical protein
MIFRATEILINFEKLLSRQAEKYNKLFIYIYMLITP